MSLEKTGLVGLCWLVLALSAGATSSVESTALTEATASAPPDSVASWDERHIRASLRIFADSQPGKTPRCLAGVMPQRRVLINPDAASVQIVEAGVPAQRLALRRDLLPEIHYVSDGRHALLATRNGWVLRLDLEQARLVAEVRAGLALGGMALSAGRPDLPALLAVANTEPHTLAVLDEQLKLLKLLRVADKTSRVTSPVAKIRTIKTRSSFIAAFTHMPELWEISYNPTAPEIALGLVHDFQYQEGTFVPGYLNPKRSMLPSPATDFLVSQSGHEVVTAHAQSNLLHPGASAWLQVTNLDAHRKVADFAVPGWSARGDTQTVLQLDNYAFDIEARLAGVGNGAAPSNPFVTDAGCTP